MRDATSRFAVSTERAGTSRSAHGGSSILSALPASADGSGAPANGHRAYRTPLLAACLSLFLLLAAALAGSADAAFIHKEGPSFEMQSVSSQPGDIAVDEATGDIYIMARDNKTSIERLKANGEPKDFPAAPGIDETQKVTFSGFSTEDTFTLTCPNGETTPPIVWNNSAATLRENMQDVLEVKCGAGGFSITSGPNNPIVHFEGPFAETDVPQMTCTTVFGSGSCSITEENDGSLTSSVIEAPCGSQCRQIVVDNTGGPNQGIIYVSSANSLTQCCPRQPAQAGGINVYAPSGEHLRTIYSKSQFEFNVRSCGVAVDANGDLIVAHGEGQTAFNYIDRLDVLPWNTNPEQEPPVTETINSSVTGNCKSAIDSAGTVYTTSGNTSTSTSQVRTFPAGAFSEPSQDGERIPPELVDANTLFDPTSNLVDVFVDAEDDVFTLKSSAASPVRKLDTSGSLIEEFGGEVNEFKQPIAVAKNSSNGTLYVSDRSTNAAAKDIHTFESVTVPDSLTGNWTPETYDEGEVDGEADPVGGGEVTNCEFQIADKGKFNSTEFAEASVMPCEPETSFNEAKAVAAKLSGLTLEEQYFFRLVTENAEGASNGTVHTFAPHAVIGLTTEPATEVEPRSATLNASFIGDSDETEYFFEYGTTDNYGQESGKATLPSPTGPQNVSLPIEELDLETTYHFRAVAVNGTGESKAFDGSFTTPPAVPGVATNAIGENGLAGVELKGQYEGNGRETNYHFEYGTTKEYDHTTPVTNLGSPTSPTPVTAVIDEFEGYTLYHYRVVFENDLGVTYGKDLTFETEPAPLPGVKNASATSVTPTTAMLNGEFNPNRWATIYLFEWGTTTEYGSSTPLTNTIGGLDHDFHPASSMITGLAPGTVYHYRAVAINLTGVTAGTDQTFFTPDAPRIEAASSSAIGQTTANLAALVAANASPTAVAFEYGPTTAYGLSTGALPIGAGTLAVVSGASLTGLVPGTTYHFRAVASNGYGATYGIDSTFVTLPGAPESEGGDDCKSLARRAQKNSSRAKSLRRKAKKASGKRARELRRKARRYAKKAGSLSKQAKACRRTSGGNG